MTTVANLGEFGLIDAIAARIRKRQPPARFPALAIGIGDDAAVWLRGDQLELAKTDALVEGIDFLSSVATWPEVGWKALAVNLSDIAAMGGRPDYALITLGVPPQTAADAVFGLYDGMLDLADRFDVALIGGDISSAKEVFISIALTGVGIRRSRGQALPLLLRSTATPGQALAVTGTLGASAAGLRMLLAGQQLPPDVTAFLRNAHLRPEPRLAEGWALIGAGVRCGMDVSDGLVADVEKLCRASSVDAVVEVERLPVDARVRSTYPDVWQELALTGGEDFELVIAAPPARIRAAQRSMATPLTIIGRIEEGSGHVRVVDDRGQPITLRQRGWVHF
ncbi:MAG: thiamine-phosphate kinase [Chloroflexi bacterium]|nr:thiamine-phosphate kinase [Chloroflexota bacterium]